MGIILESTPAAWRTSIGLALTLLLVLEKRGDGLAYEPGAQKEKRLLMPSLLEMERMLLQEPDPELSGL